MPSGFLQGIDSSGGKGIIVGVNSVRPIMASQIISKVLNVISGEYGRIYMQSALNKRTFIIISVNKTDLEVKQDKKTHKKENI